MKQQSLDDPDLSLDKLMSLAFRAELHAAVGL